MTELIQCPRCNRMQGATIQQTAPFPTFIHHCFQCGYIIMESDWQPVGFNEWAIHIHTEAAKVEPIRADEITSLRLYRRHAERVIQVKQSLKQ